MSYFENSRSLEALLANEESFETAFCRFSVTIELLFVLAPTTAIK